MEVYVARQPIFDRNMNILGYELLYRRGMDNFYEGMDENQSTATLIDNAFFNLQLYELTNGTRGFINFSREMIAEGIPLLLPKEEIVVEVLEDAEISDEFVHTCQKLRESGYMIALDDFVFHESYRPLIEIAHILKIEFPKMRDEQQKQLIQEYKGSVKFLAEKVETREQHRRAMEMGYDYFQGYFFSKPVIIRGKEIDCLNTHLIRILNELHQEEPEYAQIARIIESDLGLSYKLLRLVNSPYFAPRDKIYSIQQALARLGLIEIKKWVYIMMIRDHQHTENKELINHCLIRAKFMELLAVKIGAKKRSSEYFMTGLFSSIDVLLRRSMKGILDELPLTTDVREALLGEDNEIRRALDLVMNYERSNWNQVNISNISRNISDKEFVGIYIKALRWVLHLDD